jgi:multidrug efflux pump subunit AcrA (membrane-fusion protein)
LYSNQTLQNMALITINEVDSLLDELDRLSNSDVGSKPFWSQVLQGIKALYPNSGVVVLAQLRDQWYQVDSNLSLQEVSTLCVALNQLHTTSQTSSDDFSWPTKLTVASTVWSIVGLDSRTNSLIAIRRSLNEPTEDAPDREPILEAIAEICNTWMLRQATRHSNHRAEELHRVIHQVAAAQSTAQLHKTLVSNLAAFVNADRVSIATGRRQAQLQASSVSQSIDRRSNVVKALEKFASDAIRSNQPLVHERSDIAETSNNDQLLENAIALNWGDRIQPYVIVMEWNDTVALQQHLHGSHQSLESIETSWRERLQWLSMPAWIRSVFGRSRGYLPKLIWTLSKWLIVLGVAVVLCWLALRPYPLIITADAVLQPSLQRIIHATEDGYVQEVLVENNDSVQAGQVLAKLRSPAIELEVAEVVGEIKSISEKRNGIRIAVNQLDPNSDQAKSSESKLSSDLQILNTQETHAKERLKLLRKQQSALILTSPIAGVVVASELKELLESRPVNRGDALFTVADINGDWRLKIMLADRDTQYVDRSYPRKRTDLKYALHSSPAREFVAQVSTIDPTIENVIGTGAIRRIYANVDRDVVAIGHNGATARVSFDCGGEVAWFVWCRPMIEFIQMRTSLFSKPDR